MKKIAIMQPYFMPYLGYLSLIKHTDAFILFDTVQFIRHGWIERNRVLKQSGGDWIYIKVPLVRDSRDTLIKDVAIDNSQDWKSRMRSQLQAYKKTAPFYWDTMKVVEEIFAAEYTTITELNKKTLEAICKYLEIDRPITTFSEMNLNIAQAKAPDEWALNICQALEGVEEYWNPPGGQEFFDKKKYDDAGIELKFQKVTLTPYDQKSEEFIPGLSIIDVMMFNSPSDINKMLDNYELI